MEEVLVVQIIYGDLRQAVCSLQRHRDFPAAM